MIRRTTHLFGAVALLALSASAAKAQNTYTFNTTTTSDTWLSASHWTTSSGATSTVYPGVAGGGTGSGSTTDIAAIGVFSATVGSFGLGINFNTAVGSLSAGSIDFLANASGNLQIGDSSTTKAGVLTLNTDTLDGVSNTVVANESPMTLTLAPAVLGAGSGQEIMAVALGSATANVIQANGSGNINITSVIQNGAGNALTINSAGTGTVVFSGVNTYSGGTTITKGTLLVNGAGTAGAGPVTVNGGTIGGTGSISGAITVGSGATVQGGLITYNGAANGTLTLASPLTLNTRSIVQLAIGSNLGHGTLATSGVTFDQNQAFSIFETATTTTGTYANIITGLTSDPGTESTWTATGNYGGFVGSFAYDAAGNGIDLIVTTVPEPATVLGGVLLIAAAGWSQRCRLRGAMPV